MAWTIKGVSGATLNATARTFAQLGITKCDLIFRSAAADTLSWTATLATASGGGTIIPDDKQVVEIFDGSSRRFRGFVSGVRTGLRSVQVQVSNAWWLMEQEDLTSVRTDDSGATATRPKYVAAKGELATMIRNLIDRMIALGIPLQRGGVADMYPMTRVTLARMSCAAGLVKLLQRCPDAVTWFDYSGATGTDPILRVARRGGADAMDSITYALGTDPIVRGESDLQSRIELKVSRVELNYLDRHPTTGKIRFQVQANGTGALGETQKITIAGDELVSFLPKNDYETYDIQTVASGGTFVNSMESSLVAVRKQYGSSVSVGIATGQSLEYWNRYSTNASGVARPDEAYGTTAVATSAPYFVARNGKLPSIAGKYFLITENLPDWVNKLPGVVVREGTYFGTMLRSFVVGYPDGSPGADPITPKWVYALGMSKVIARKWIKGTTNLQDVWSKNFSVPCTLISLNHPTVETLYKPFDYDFEQCSPDSGMAVGLRIAQGWIPHEGRLTLAPGNSMDGVNLLNHAINLANSLPRCSSMRALAKQLSYDLIQKRMVWSLGPPARMDFGTSSGRVPGSSQDLVEFI